MSFRGDQITTLLGPLPNEHYGLLRDVDLWNARVGYVVVGAERRLRDRAEGVARTGPARPAGTAQAWAL